MASSKDAIFFESDKCVIPQDLGDPRNADSTDLEEVPFENRFQHNTDFLEELKKARKRLLEDISKKLTEDKAKSELPTLPVSVVLVQYGNAPLTIVTTLLQNAFRPIDQKNLRTKISRGCFMQFFFRTKQTHIIDVHAINSKSASRLSLPGGPMRPYHTEEAYSQSQGAEKEQLGLDGRGHGSGSQDHHEVLSHDEADDDEDDDSDDASVLHVQSCDLRASFHNRDYVIIHVVAEDLDISRANLEKRYSHNQREFPLVIVLVKPKTLRGTGKGEIQARQHLNRILRFIGEQLDIPPEKMATNASDTRVFILEHDSKNTGFRNFIQEYLAMNILRICVETYLHKRN